MSIEVTTCCPCRFEASLYLSVGFPIYSLSVFTGAPSQGQFFSVAGGFRCMTLECLDIFGI